MEVHAWILVLLAVVAAVSGDPEPWKTGYGPGDQDWGWIEVRKGAHMFYWLHRARTNPKGAPLLIWLQGGPGASSTGYGNFAEIGTLHTNGKNRETAWTQNMDVLFIDNPVGTGFSYVTDTKLLTKNNSEIAKDMVTFLKAFSETHNYDCTTTVSLFGESYGGKMGVEIIKLWEEELKTSDRLFKIKSITLVAPWLSPIDSIMSWPPLLLSVGLIDGNGHQRLVKGANNIKTALDKKEYDKATYLWNEQMGLVCNETGNIDFYNFLTRLPIRKNDADGGSFEHLRRSYLEVEEDKVIAELMNGPVRKALKIPDKIVYGKQSKDVFNALTSDIVRGYPHIVEHLLNNTNVKVFVMSGQLDVTVATYGTYNWVNKLNWKGSSVWAKAERTPIIVNDIIEGYVTNAGNLAFYWVNRAGHMVPKDNPVTAFKLAQMIAGR